MNYLHEQASVKSKTGVSIKVDKDGSLGLLALGDIGLQLWRREKLAHHASKTTVTSLNISSIPKITKA